MFVQNVLGNDSEDCTNLLTLTFASDGTSLPKMRAFRTTLLEIKFVESEQ